MIKKATEVTEVTITTLESILSDEDLITFNSAKEIWQGATKNTLNNLKNMACIGTALSLLYSQGEAKGMKRDAITDMVRIHFEGLDRRERSDYRKLAEDYVQVKLFVEFTGVKSCNPSYLINSWRKAMTEDRVACQLIETTLAGGVDAQGKVMSEKVDATEKDANILDLLDPTNEDENRDVLDLLDPIGSTNKNKVNTESELLKTGFTNIVTPEPLTTKELAEQVGAIINQVKTAFNTGRFDKDAESLLLIEKQLTSGLQHINNVDLDTVNPIQIAV